MSLEPDPKATQQGFSLIEVLAVLIISSTLLVSLNTLVMMSQRSFIEFTDASNARSQEFFFEQQFAAFAGALEQDSHPDIEESCRLTGTETKLNGCFYNVFKDDRPVQLFEISIAKTDGTNVMRLEIDETAVEWTQSTKTIAIGYMTADGETGSAWPPEQTAPPSTSPNAAAFDRPPTPRAIVLEFGDTDKEDWERRVFATENY